MAVSYTHLDVYKRQVQTDHPLFIGNLGMHGAYAANMAVSECDLLFSIGTRFNDRITGKLHEFAPNAQIVHIDIDTASISRNIHVHVPIVADAKEAVAKMREYVEPCETKEWLERIAQWNAEHPLTMKVHGSIGPRDIIEEMNLSLIHIWYRTGENDDTGGFKSREKRCVCK